MDFCEFSFKREKEHKFKQMRRRKNWEELEEEKCG